MEFNVEKLEMCEEAVAFVFEAPSPQPARHRLTAPACHPDVTSGSQWRTGSRWQADPEPRAIFKEVLLLENPSDWC